MKSDDTGEERINQEHGQIQDKAFTFVPGAVLADVQGMLVEELSLVKP